MAMCKVLFLISCIFGMSHARTPLEIKQYMLSKSMECSADNTVSTKEMQMLLNHELPNTKASKCFIACIFKKFGWLDDKGMYNLESVHKFAQEEYVGDAEKLENGKKLFDMCARVNDETPADGEAGCDRANSLAKCLIDNAPKLGFHIQLGGETK